MAEQQKEWEQEYNEQVAYQRIKEVAHQLIEEDVHLQDRNTTFTAWIIGSGLLLAIGLLMPGSTDAWWALRTIGGAVLLIASVALRINGSWERRRVNRILEDMGWGEK